MFRERCNLISEYDAEGRAPLHTAVAYHQTDTVRYLITPKTVNKSFEGNDEMDMLEASGAGVDPAQPTGYGTTALEEAKERGFNDIPNGQESKPLLSLDFGQESKPLLSLDYVPDLSAWQITFTGWEYTLNPYALL
ncbi:unnamed protein product [Rodentolepis nana]|uniref:ANK_REP_REGION domain-containing protein n=1 Tax=Rodentolepis nana TaxID=102285 RepID=A0A0R3TZ80_RODNA|nr:unnamed protein product [Rodentolepis nana]